MGLLRSKEEKNLRTLFRLLLKMAKEANKKDLNNFKNYQQRFNNCLEKTFGKINNKNEQYMTFDEIRNTFINSFHHHSKNEEENNKKQKAFINKGIKLLKEKKKLLLTPKKNQ